MDTNGKTLYDKILLIQSGEWKLPTFDGFGLCRDTGSENRYNYTPSRTILNDLENLEDYFECVGDIEDPFNLLWGVEKWGNEFIEECKKYDFEGVLRH